VNSDSDEALSIFFSNNGLQSMHATLNMGSTFVYLIVVLGLYLVLGSLKLASHLLKK